MSEAEGFVRAIAEDPYDAAVRLVYADWLEDHGDPRRAELIRVQCELEPIRDRYEIARACELHAREGVLLREHRKEWLGPMPEGWDDWQTGAGVEFRRGFVDVVSMPVRTFLALGPEVLRLHPTVRRLVLFRVNGYGERLAACPALAGLPEMELACWYSDEDAEAIAASPHLGRLRVLELWLARRDDESTDGRLCRIMAASKAWPSLRELTLLDPDPEDDHERARKRLVSVADKVAGRKLAVYRRGFPDLFPFAADFWYTFPGYLPGGRMAMAKEDARTSPPTLWVITFDRKGRQTKDVLRVPMPPELLSIPPREWYQHKERMKQQLIDEIGFRPGFIRVRDCCFPGDDHGYNRPHWDYFEGMGEVDSDDEDSWQEEPCGFGGWGTYHVRETQWVFGWDRFGDKSGTIHST
jgi:uncharacterized protein (TIGR02996 family)